MADETCTWTGKSGTTYLFYVYERPPATTDRLGNFIYSRQNSEKLWLPAYLGHGDLAQCAEHDAAVIACIEAWGATHVHMRLGSTETERLTVHADLLAAYRNAFRPEGCNDPDEPGELTTGSQAP